jgi:glycosyltransferase involved in cell wall biosynthesis
MKPEITIVLPAYQEEESIELCLQRLISSLDKAGVSFEARVIVDGPGDRTADIVRSITDPRISVTELPENSGKGRAIRTGFISCKTEFIGFIDADLDLHPEGLVAALQRLKASPPNVCAALGSKIHPESKVEYPLVRRFLSTAYKTFVRIGFSLNLNDTQTGLKVFRTPVINEVLPLLQCDGFEFDLELLCRLSRNGYSFVEVPIDLDYKFKSTVNIRTGVKTLIATFWLAVFLRKS